MRKHKLLKVWQLILLDCLAIGLCLVIFAYFDHVRPQALTMPDTTVSESASRRQALMDAQTSQTVQTAPAETQAPAEEADPSASQTEPSAFEAGLSPVGVFDFPGIFASGETEITADSYRSKNLYITVKNVTHTKGENGSKYDQSYYIIHVYVRYIDSLQSVFAQDTYGDNILEGFMPMVGRTGALAAVNTDFYGYGRHPKGLLIRNGILYGDQPNGEYDILIVNEDGTFDMYPAGTCPDVSVLMEKGAWHSFSFGPILVKDGKRMSSYSKDDRDPRTCIGIVEPGHYVFAVCDGRQDNYAKGYNYKGMAEILLGEGCVAAYNLDGGGSSQLSFLGKLTNHPYNGGRELTDVLIVKEPY